MQKTKRNYHEFFLIGIIILAILFFVSREYPLKEEKDAICLLDQTYVINLDRSIERYQHMKKILKDVPLVHQRFSAIDGYKVRLEPLSGGKAITGLELKNKTAELVPNETYKVLCTQNAKDQKYPLHYYYDYEKYPAVASAGELGCLCSHFLIWQDIAEHEYKAALVLEDDIINFNSNFLEFVNKIIANLPHEALVHLYPTFFLNNLHERANDLHQISFDYNGENNLFLCKISSTTRVLGTHSYIINSSMAKKLLDKLIYDGNGVDEVMASKANAQEISLYTAFCPPLSVEYGNKERSTISQMGRDD